MPSIGLAFNTEVEEVPPVQPPPVQPPPVPPVIPTPPFFDVIKQWWNSLSTIQKILVVAGVSGSAVAVVGLSRRKKE